MPTAATSHNCIVILAISHISVNSIQYSIFGTSVCYPSICNLLRPSACQMPLSNAPTLPIMNECYRHRQIIENAVKMYLLWQSSSNK